MAENVLISHLNRIDGADLSGGSWQAAHPLENLKDRLLAKDARSSDASPCSSVIDCDFGRLREIRAVALVNHNLSLEASLLLQLRDAPAGGGNLVAGMAAPVPAWPDMFPGEPGEQGRPPTDEEAASLPNTFVHLFPAAAQARYLRLEISDAANPEGFISLGRLWAGPAWQPTRNAEWGMSLGWNHDCPEETSLSGVKYFGRGVKYRSGRFSLTQATDADGFTALDLTCGLGVSGEALVSLEPDSALNLSRVSFLARLKQLAPLSYPSLARKSTSFEFEELV